MKYGCISDMLHKTIFERKQNKPKVHEQYTIIFLDHGPLFGVRDTFSYPSFFYPLALLVLCGLFLWIKNYKVRHGINRTNIFSSLHEMVVSYNVINHSSDLFLFWFPLGSLPGCFWEKASGQSRQARQRYCNGDNEERTCAAYKTKTS